MRLKGNMKKAIEAERYYKWNTGYVYFTTDPDQAVMFGLIGSLSDIPNLTDVGKKMIPNYRDVVVIAIDSSKLKGLEWDPESSATFAECMRLGKTMIIQFYRYKGDIKLENLSLHKYRSFDTFSSNLINKMKQDVLNRQAACKILMQETQQLNSSSSFIELLEVMDKVRSVRGGIY